jgi:hypothetical protein
MISAIRSFMNRTQSRKKQLHSLPRQHRMYAKGISKIYFPKKRQTSSLPLISKRKTKKKKPPKQSPIPSSILIDNPQTPPWIKQHAHKSRLLPRQQILRRAPPPLRRIATPSTPTRNTALRVRPAGCFAPRYAIAPALRARLASPLLRRQQAYYSRHLLAAGLALRHLDVLFVEAELFAVDESAEEEVAD